MHRAQDHFARGGLAGEPGEHGSVIRFQGIQPEQDGHVAPGQARVPPQALHFRRHPFALLGPVPMDYAAHGRVPQGAPRFQALAQMRGLVPEHAVGVGDDGCGRTVIDFQLEDGHAREMLQRLSDIARIGAPESVNGLIVVPHQEQAWRRAAQQLDQFQLVPRRILEFVHQDPGVTRAQIRKHVGVPIEQADGQGHHVVEGEHARVHEVGPEPHAQSIPRAGQGRGKRRGPFIGPGIPAEGLVEPFLEHFNRRFQSRCLFYPQQPSGPHGGIEKFRVARESQSGPVRYPLVTGPYQTEGEGVEGADAGIGICAWRKGTCVGSITRFRR